MSAMSADYPYHHEFILISEEAYISNLYCSRTSMTSRPYKYFTTPCTIPPYLTPRDTFVTAYLPLSLKRRHQSVSPTTCLPFVRCANDAFRPSPSVPAHV